ncbi:MAG: MarR family transcriptional regulator [Thermomicrobiales bacterium]|nr:MarR family transcriptional regulator [Thermomicrobiales bacterium]MCO5227522.1 MarR family transcriptional regulator [Thermomicrobiales bacterium]
MATTMSRASVHPKWLVFDDSWQAPHEALANADSLRYHAFMQLIRTAGALDRAATDALVDLELTAGAYGALVELAEVGETGIAPSELARRLAVARRTATLYVDILAKHGWATREAHPEDRRMVLARLTPAGAELLERVGHAYQHRLSLLLGDMSSYQAEMLQELLAIIPTDRDPVSEH